MGCFCFGDGKKKENKYRRRGRAFTGKPQGLKSGNIVGYSGNNQSHRNNKASGGATRDGDMVIMIGTGAALAVAAEAAYSGGAYGGSDGNYGGDGGASSSGGGCGGGGCGGGC